MTSTKHEDVIQTLPTDRTDPPLRHGVRLRSADRCLHHREPFGPEDLVERAGEFRVSIPEKDGLVLEGTIDGKVPSLLGDPSRVRPAGGAGDVHASGRQLDEEQDVQGLQEHGLHREEVAGQYSPPLCSQELAPGGARAARRGTQAGAAKDAADGARANPDPELAELALDPHAPPSRVLLAETEDEVGRLGIERPPSRTPKRVGPLAPYEFSVPSKERLRRDNERGPTIPGKGPTRRGEEGPVSVFEFGTPDCAAQHTHLVAENGILELKLADASASSEDSNQPNKQKVGQPAQGAEMLLAEADHDRNPCFGAPQGLRGMSRRRGNGLTQRLNREQVIG